MKRKFWLAHYEWGTQLIQEDKQPKHDDYFDGEWEGEKITEEPNPSGEQLAEWMDSEAENANAHRLADTHIWLYEIVKKHGGVEVADKVFREIADDRNWLSDT